MISVCLMHTLSSLCAMLCLPYLLGTPRWALFVSLHLCTLAYMFMHESLCVLMSSSLVPTTSCRFTPILDTRDLESLQEFCLMACMSSMLQSHGTMNTRSKPTFVHLGHPLFFDNMDIFPHWLSLIVCPFACFFSNCFFACLLACLLYHYMYTLGVRV